MTADCAMTGLRVAVEPDVLDQEMSECLKQRTVPVLRSQDAAEYPLEASVLVTCQAHASRKAVDGFDLPQVRRANHIQRRTPASIDRRQLESSSHELIVVHPLSWGSNSRPGSKIVSISLAF